MQIRVEQQQSPVADEVAALFAVVRPILEGLLYGLKANIVAEAGGRDGVKLEVLTRLYEPGDGDCGICFEYAVHDAMRRNDPQVVERVEHALGLCNIPGGELGSILFGAEKAGSQQLIETAKEALTEDSLLMYGQRGRPARLKRQIDLMAQAFRSKKRTDILPDSISGLWKADLFLGHTDTDKWVGTSVKINAGDLEPVKGLRVGVVPVKSARVICPSKMIRRISLSVRFCTTAALWKSSTLDGASFSSSSTQRQKCQGRLRCRDLPSARLPRHCLTVALFRWLT